MTFSRAKSTGWTNDVDTITATQINQIDVNQSRAVDGTAGGTYTPSVAITVNGAGVKFGTDTTTGIAQAYISGPVVFAGNTATRVDRQASVADAATQTIAVTADRWTCATPTAQRDHTLSNTGASDGMSMKISRPSTGAFAIILHRQGSNPGAAVVTLGASTNCTAEVVMRGGVWRLASYSAGCTPGAEAD